MPSRESGNHESGAFSLGLPPSSQNAQARLLRYSDALSNAWAFGLLLSILLGGVLFADAAAFTRIARVLDRPLLVWLEAVVGYLCIASVSINLRRRLKHSGLATSSIALSVLALTSYGYHLFLLRWPWLVGDAEPTGRYAIWSAVLSSTWRGVPLLAFGELLAILILLCHGLLGLSVATPWLRLGRATPRLHPALVAGGLLSYVLASAVIIALATGRR
jgi:hypothetical protein